MSDVQADRPVMPPPDAPPEKRSHKRRGRPAGSGAAAELPPAVDPAALRLTAAQENGKALAPYLAAVLEAVESVAGLRGVDAEKRAAAANALAVATAYTFPVIDPLWLVWGAAAAACLDAYKVPVQNMGKPVRLAAVSAPAPSMAVGAVDATT
jgi:hypothetical protein